MALQRPTSLLVFGILCIVFGTLGLLQGLCGGIFLLSGLQEKMTEWQQSTAAMTNDPQQKEAVQYQVDSQDAMEAVPLYQANLTGTMISTLILCVLLIVGGVGLIRVAPWGRYVALTYAVLSILSSLWGLIYTLFVTLPAMNAFFDRKLEHAGPQVASTIQITRYGLYFAPLMMLCYFIFPGLLLFWLLRRPSVEAFRKGGIEVPDGDESDARDRRDKPDFDDRRDDRTAEGGEGFYPK